LETGNFTREIVSVHFSHTCFVRLRTRSVLTDSFAGGGRDVVSSRTLRRAHHEAWLQSELSQREYCEAYRIPIKTFGNWRARFKAEPQPPVRKLFYRRRGLSHTLSHSVSHITYGGAEPIVPPAREGRRRKFSEADKRRIIEEAVQPGTSLSEVARHYGIAARVLFRWKQELT
jgi:transposase